MPKESNQLAIVIPAYKGRFLGEALESIAMQTDKRFTVYVGDDASPDNIEEICDGFKDRLDLVYTRFNENLGHDSLVAHWNRCIEVSSEPWIWLFCDDDVMAPECVEMFYQTLAQENNKFKVLRFNTLTINDEGEVTQINPPHPLTESGGQFIYHRLKAERLSYVSEYIFSRESYRKTGGMVDFPLAWCSDDASWLAFSKDSAIRTIQGAYVLWRRGAFNITPSGAKHQTERVEAACRFVQWLDDFIRINGTGNQYLTRAMIMELARSWFLRQIKAVAPIDVSNYVNFARFISSVTEANWRFSYPFLLAISLNAQVSKLKRAGK